MAIVLIALNFVREQRWFIVLMLLYVGVVNGLMYYATTTRERDPETLLVVKQEAFYALFFSVIIASAVFQNERKTRRILAVLSKAVSRAEYVAGIVVGVNLCVLVYLAGFAAGVFLLVPEASIGAIGRLLLTVAVASLLGTVVTVFYASFMHPMVATAAAGATLALSAALERLVPGGATFVPVYALMRDAARFSAEPGYAIDERMVVLGVVQAVAIWLAASWVFARRDITAPVE